LPKVNKYAVGNIVFQEFSNCVLFIVTEYRSVLEPLLLVEEKEKKKEASSEQNVYLDLFNSNEF
jgi:hypothetical protein